MGVFTTEDKQLVMASVLAAKGISSDKKNELMMKLLGMEAPPTPVLPQTPVSVPATMLSISPAPPQAVEKSAPKKPRGRYRKGQRLTHTEKLEIVWLLINTRATKAYISEKYNVSFKTIERILSKPAYKTHEGVKPTWLNRKAWDEISEWASAEYDRYSEQMISEIKWLVANSNMTYRAIGSRYRRGPTMVPNLLRRHAKEVEAAREIKPDWYTGGGA